MNCAKLTLDSRWRLSSPEMPGTEVAMTIPGDNYSALLSAGVIPDPYWGKNEKQIQKYAGMLWNAEQDFTLDKDFLKHKKVILELERADTLISVFINGHKVLDSDNMFRRYRVEVKKHLQPGTNHIKLCFHPVLPECAKRNKKLPIPAPMVLCCPTPHLNLIRKTLCHGGWDWGIQLLVSGVYAPIHLYGTSDILPEQPETVQTFTSNGVKVKAKVRVESFCNCTCSFTFRFDGKTETVQAALVKGWNEVSADFLVTDPKLWWPNGLGEAHLYLLEVEAAGQIRSSRIGLRKIEIINRKDRWGKSFIFRVNGIDVFSKGANWIPPDALPLRQTFDKYENILESMRQANMNMVRVWGGGQYEQEYFYDLCDEKGLLVWQDLMFACCLYPTTPEFLDNVGKELEYQVPRLRKHACLALWCGDNEVSGAVRWRSNSRTDLLVRNHIQYDRLNKMLTEKVNQLDPARIFWPSSPSAGPDVLNDGWRDDTQGDMHYWEVWHGGRGFNAYRTVKPRFCSEFGFESFPSMETIDSFCPPEQQNLFSPVMDQHQKCATGSTPILAMFGSQFRMPSDFAKTVYLSQVQQGIAIRTGAEFWRSSKPRCMGTLFWQLNDNWPTVSWSALEYSGKWKVLMYQARRFYAPVMLAVIAESDERTILTAVSDLLKDVTLDLNISFHTFDGKVLSEEKRTVTLPAGKSLNLGEIRVPGEKQTFPEEVFCEIRSVPNPEVNNGEALQCTYFFVPVKNCELAAPELQTAVVSSGKNSWEIQLKAENPAFHVVLDLPGIPGRFSDNDFTVMPGEVKIVRFLPWETRTDLETQLKNNLKIMDLYESYH